MANKKLNFVLPIIKLHNLSIYKFFTSRFLTWKMTTATPAFTVMLCVRACVCASVRTCCVKGKRSIMAQQGEGTSVKDSSSRPKTSTKRQLEPTPNLLNTYTETQKRGLRKSHYSRPVIYSNQTKSMSDIAYSKFEVTVCYKRLILIVILCKITNYCI